ncbi:MAG: glycosyltransferase, partial [Candidatus Thermoplasmatota archaeon]|nr:glycosyltransferase [Candidatus Thermoplasmatota archaeon]
HRLGHLSDELYRSAFAVAKVLALPSEYEAFGIVLLEAAAAGLPAVATRVGGVPEAIIEGETGLLVEYGDATPLAAALGRLLDDPAGAREMGRKGRERARDEFDWDSIVARVEQLYLSLF